MNESDYVSLIGTHEGITFKCPQCDKEFRSENSFKKHCKAELSGKTHRCSQCGKTFMLETSLQNHVKTHSGISYKCEVKNDCEFKTISYLRYREHNKYDHRDTKDFPCTVCNTPLQTLSEIRSHRTKQHGHVRKMPQINLL